MNRFCFSMLLCVLLEIVNIDGVWAQDAAEKPVVLNSRAAQIVEGIIADEPMDTSRMLSPTAEERFLHRPKFDSLRPFMVMPQEGPKAPPEPPESQILREFREFAASGLNWLKSGHNLYWSVCVIFVIGYISDRMRR